jgi:hypothetical protein
VVLGGLLWGSEDLGGGWDGEFAEGFTFGPFSFKLEILVKFELLMMIQVCKHSGTSSVPVSVILKAGSHVTKNYWFSCNTADCITFCLLDFVVLKASLLFEWYWFFIQYQKCIGFWYYFGLYWILVLLWSGGPIGHIV